MGKESRYKFLSKACEIPISDINYTESHQFMWKDSVEVWSLARMIIKKRFMWHLPTDVTYNDHFPLNKAAKTSIGTLNTDNLILSVTKINKILWNIN